MNRFLKAGLIGLGLSLVLFVLTMTPVFHIFFKFHQNAGHDLMSVREWKSCLKEIVLALMVVPVYLLDILMFLFHVVLPVYDVPPLIPIVAGGLMGQSLIRTNVLYIPFPTVTAIPGVLAYYLAHHFVFAWNITMRFTIIPTIGVLGYVVEIFFMPFT